MDKAKEKKLGEIWERFKGEYGVDRDLLASVITYNGHVPGLG